MRRHLLALFALCTGALAAGGCGPRLDVGSDLLWTATFEGNSFDEWTLSRFGGAVGAAPPNAIAVSDVHPHAGAYAAMLTIDAGSDGNLESSSMSLTENLPVDAYYSAWYYLPHSTSVNGYWVIMKFRRRTDPADASTEGELFDLDLTALPSGEMSMYLFDHRTASNAHLIVAQPVVPVDYWFNVEAHYRNTADATGRLTVWLGGLEILDLSGPMAPSPWVEWGVTNLAENLSPSSNVLYVDDCAISASRIGPSAELP